MGIKNTSSIYNFAHAHIIGNRFTKFAVYDVFDRDLMHEVSNYNLNSHFDFKELITSASKCPYKPVYCRTKWLFRSLRLRQAQIHRLYFRNKKTTKELLPDDALLIVLHFHGLFIYKSALPHTKHDIVLNL